jgi:hypothetical protein
MNRFQAGSNGKAETATRDKNVSGAADSGRRVRGTRTISEARLDKILEGGNVKKIFSILIVLLALAGSAAAQATTHSVTLSWTDTLNPATGTTYNVYRATGLCSGTPVFSKLASAIAVKSFTDSTVTPGNYCYTVTASVAGVESAQATPVNPTVPAFPVTAISFTVQ